jgi:hypothetical protein
MQPKYGPHQIPHDEKYLSRGDFDTQVQKKGGGGMAPKGRRSTVLSDDGSDTLVGSTKGSNFGSKKSSKGKLTKFEKEDYVPKDVQIIDWIKEQKSPRRRRWWILLIVILFLGAILIPVLVIKLQQ